MQSCNDFLESPSIISSYHTDQQFKFLESPSIISSYHTDQQFKFLESPSIISSYHTDQQFKFLESPSIISSYHTDQQFKFLESPSIISSYHIDQQFKFLESPSIISSYHTDQQFKFKHTIDCCSKFVIYKFDDVICKKCYVGSTTIGIRERWHNHKSHIRNNIKSCELSTHFSENSNHNFNRKSSIIDFDKTFKNHLRITIIDCISDISDSSSNELNIKLLKQKEAFWQNNLKTLKKYGGLNIRDGRKESKDKAYRK